MAGAATFDDLVYGGRRGAGLARLSAQPRPDRLAPVCRTP
jgi:hypothetical protein